METFKRREAPASKTIFFFKPLSYIHVIIHSFSVLFLVKSGILVRYLVTYTIMLCTNVLPLPYGFSAPTYVLVPDQPMWNTYCTKWQWEKLFPMHFSFPLQYRATNASSSYFIHLPLIQYNFSNWQHYLTINRIEKKTGPPNLTTQIFHCSQNMHILHTSVCTHIFKST
jgi:hypothetical protein